VSKTTTRDRLSHTYARYRGSRRKRRAWAADNPGNVAMRDELLERLIDRAGPQLRTGDVLDIGCGTGWWLRALADRGVPPTRLHGVDLLDERLTAAAKRVPGAELQRADARELPYAGGSFGVVLLFTVLSSMATRGDVLTALSEARRVLAPDGVLLCYEPRVPNAFNRSTRHIGRRDLDRALEPGWDSIPVTVLPPLSRRLGRLTGWTYPRLARARVLLTHRLVSSRAAGTVAPSSPLDPD